MTESRDYLELSYYSVNAFANDGKLDEGELDKLLDIAIRDGKVDDNETRVLKNIFSRLKSYELSYSMKQKIRAVEQKYDIKVTD